MVILRVRRAASGAHHGPAVRSGDVAAENYRAKVICSSIVNPNFQSRVAIWKIYNAVRDYAANIDIEYAKVSRWKIIFSTTDHPIEGSFFFFYSDVYIDNSSDLDIW